MVYFGGFFAKLGHFAGFPLLIINFAVYVCTFAKCVFNTHKKNKKRYEQKNKMVALPGECVRTPPPLVRGRTHSLGGEGGGGSIFWKTPGTSLYSSYVSTL